MQENHLPEIELAELSSRLTEALKLATLLAYAEGFEMLRAASAEHGWSLDLPEICRIWQGGCIIRAAQLVELRAALAEDADFYRSPLFAKLVNRDFAGLKAITIATLMAGVSAPCFAAATQTVEQLRRGRGSANFIQGLRDAFGAHGYKKLDGSGPYHANWS